MKERPINFKAWEVRAIREGRKTQFRRPVKPQPEDGATLGFLILQPAAKGSCAHFHHVDQQGIHSKELTVHCPYGQPGDRLWVRETFRLFDSLEECACYESCSCSCFRYDGKPVFRATHPDDEGPWRPSIHMPRWASRITLEVVSVRVERLNEISEGDAKAEGVFFVPGEGMALGHYLGGIYPRHGVRRTFPTPMQAYRSLWESINGHGSWGDRWVWVGEFRQV